MNKSFIFLLVFVISSCTPNYKDLSKYNLNPEEKREWREFQSDYFNITLLHPDEMTAKDSDDIKDAINIYNSAKSNGSQRFNMLIKAFDAGGMDLEEAGRGMVEGASYQWNYIHKHSGLIDYGNKRAFHHEYTTTTFLNETTRHYQLVYPIDGEQFLVTFSADIRYFYKEQKKMHKILRTLRVE
jgi:hypothetical protein